MTELEINPN